jgi:sugar/nucleoside kinase (ribokinase family)
VALALGMSIRDALKWAPINPMSVVQKIGAQAGLLTRPELERYLKRAPKDYEPKVLE